MSGKRTMISSSPRHAKKTKSIGDAANINAIVKALEDESLLAKVHRGARTMLAAGASYALATAVEERHAMQADVIENIREVFAEITEGLQAKVVEAKQVVDNKTKDFDSLQGQLVAAMAEVDEAGIATNTALEQLTVKKDAENESCQRVKEALSKQKANTREKDVLDKEKGKYSAIENGNLKTLLDGSLIDQKTFKAASAKLIKDLEKIGTEASLLASVPAVLMKKPEERKGFDQMVIDSLKADLAEKQTPVDEKIAANASAAVEINERVAAEEQSAEELRKNTEHATELSDNAKKVHEEKIAALTSLESTSGKLTEDIHNFRAEAAKAENAAACFEDVVESLETLAARSNAPVPAAADEEMPVDATEASAGVTVGGV